MPSPTLADALKGIAEAFSTAVDTAQEHLQTHNNPSWLDHAEAYLSHVVGVIFLLIRLSSAVAVLMWTGFLLVLPLGLGVAILVFIAETASHRMWP